MKDLFWIAAAVLYLGAYAASARFVYRDALRRGEDGWAAVAFVSLAAWPFSLFIWYFIRAGLSFNRDGSGTAWG